MNCRPVRWIPCTYDPSIALRILHRLQCTQYNRTLEKTSLMYLRARICTAKSPPARGNRPSLTGSRSQKQAPDMPTITADSIGHCCTCDTVHLGIHQVPPTEPTSMLHYSRFTACTSLGITVQKYRAHCCVLPASARSFRLLRGRAGLIDA
jgi:hypothetical protein